MAVPQNRGGPMTITDSAPLASHLAELDVDITLGCNYIINWRYREQTVVQHQSGQAIFRLGHCALFTGWGEARLIMLRLTWIQPRGAITHNNGWPMLWMGPRLTHSICYQLPLDPFQRKHLGEAHILMAAEHTVWVMWIGWKSNTTHCCWCPSSHHQLAPPLINVSLSSLIPDIKEWLPARFYYRS